MNKSDLPEDGAALHLSALLDGEANPASVSEACRHWRSDAQSRADWHAYSLIGDVLRAGDLAQPPAHDLAFLNTVRERLAQEPVVLAPTGSQAEPAGAPTPRARRQRWTTPVGIAAGVALVAGLASTMRPPSDNTEPTATFAAAPVLTLTQAAVPDSLTSSTAAKPDVPSPLEPYLNAHRMVPGKAAFGPAPGFMRSVAHDPVAR